MKIGCLVFVVALGLGGCDTMRTTLPQRSDLFQLTNDAQLAYETGEDAKAEQLYMALARATPGDFEVWLRLGNLYARAGKPDAAADAYQRALSINSSDARVWYNLGIIRLRQGWASVIQAQAHLDEKHPLYAETIQLLGSLNQLSGIATQPKGAPQPKSAPPPRKEEGKK